MTNLRRTYRVTWTIEVDATSPEAAAEMAKATDPDNGGLTTTPDAMDGTGEHVVGVAGVSIKTRTARLAEYTAALHSHGKLIETVVEIAWNMALCRFRPNDSYAFHHLAKDWAAEFEALYDDRVASDEWDDDTWREWCKHLTREKVDAIVLAWLGRNVAWGEP